MSYCRFSEGDVYLFRSESVDGEHEYLECCGCRLTEKSSYLVYPDDRVYDLMIKQAEEMGLPFTRGEPYEADGGYRSQYFDTPEEALEHLLEHQEAGHRVPETALERLRAEIEGREYVRPLSPEEVQEEILWFCQENVVPELGTIISQVREAQKASKSEPRHPPRLPPKLITPGMFEQYKRENLGRKDEDPEKP